MILHEMTLPAFVEELASNSPAPGGGSIAALGGALAAGLVSMVGELTRGREKYAAAQADMELLCAKGKEYAATLLKLIDEDTAAFNDFMAAMKLPKDTDEQKAARRAAMQEAAKGTVEAPLRTLNLCAEVAKLALVAPPANSPAPLAPAPPTTCASTCLASRTKPMPPKNARR